jgi:hypothetical protein
VGWFFINIVLPIIAPVLSIILLRALPVPPPAGGLSMLVPIKDGQLCWGAIAFCASGLYDIGSDGTIVSSNYNGWINVGVIILLVPSSLFAAVGAAFSTDINVPPGTKWHSHFSMLAASLVLTPLAGTAYTVVRYFSLKPHA